jgi:predicted ABC-type ATPase
VLRRPGRPGLPEDRQEMTDQPASSERAGPRSREDLRHRLGSLPDWHPSSPDRDSRAIQPDAQLADDPQLRPEPLTDAEHADRIRHIRAQLANARQRGLASDKRFFDPADKEWTTDRQLIHRDLVDGLYASAADVPCDHKAIMAGGLAGAGKSTVLDRRAGIDRSQYLTINPDDVKELMASSGLIPELDGLSPMEASDLIHAESSYIAKRLARRAMDDGKNIIWDITMSSMTSTSQRIDDLDRAGYETTGIFVHIGIAEALRRADARHRSGHEAYRAGIGNGGRHVPAEVIEPQADPEWGSVNRRTFEHLKHRFVAWAVYDNSARGRDPELIASSDGGSERRSSERGDRPDR